MTIVSLVGVLYPGIWFVVINSICPEKVSPVKYPSSIRGSEALYASWEAST